MAPLIKLENLDEASRSRLWIDTNGRINCIKHAGHYMLSAVTADPRASEHFTPLEHWIAVDHFAFAGMFDGLTCEGC